MLAPDIDCGAWLPPTPEIPMLIINLPTFLLVEPTSLLVSEPFVKLIFFYPLKYQLRAFGSKLL
jgi:hypothetical protein